MIVGRRGYRAISKAREIVRGLNTDADWRRGKGWGGDFALAYESTTKGSVFRIRIDFGVQVVTIIKSL